MERAWLSHDIAHAYLEAAVRAKLEALMEAGTHQPYSEFGKKWYAKGEAEGEAKGKLEGKADAVLAVLAARGFAPTDEQKARILGCRDLATLDRWVGRAASATSVDEALI
jgi:hypothetical protein